MTFDSLAKSDENSRPIELYEFAISSTPFRYHNVDDAVIVADGEDYFPEAISRSGISVRSEDRTSELVVTLPADNVFAVQYIDIVPGQRATLTLRRFQRDEGTGDTILIYKGLVESVSFDRNREVANISIRSLETATSRQLPRFTYQGLCNNILYDGGCKVVETLFRFDGTVSAVVGSTLTVPGLTAEVDGYYDGGFIFFPSINDYRLILSHVGDDITILLPFPTDAVSATVQVFAGCDHTLPVCKTKFDNVINYMGFAFVPSKNPFETGI